MRSVLITGGSGFFGRAFVKRLLEMANEPLVMMGSGRLMAFSAPPPVERICIFSRGEAQQAAMARDFGNDERLRFFIGDVRDPDRLRRAMQGCDVVVHAAALKRIEVGHYNPDEMVKTNVIGAMNVIESADRAKVSKVVFLSSDKAYQPVSPYGQTKALAESLFLAANRTHAHGPRYATTRYGNVWLSTGSVVPTWKAALARGGVPKITDPEATRFFMTSAEAVDLVLRTIETMPDDPAIPALPAYRLGDLAEAMDIGTLEHVGLGTFEKKHENMCEDLCSVDARRMTVDELREALTHA